MNIKYCLAIGAVAGLLAGPIANAAEAGPGKSMTPVKAKALKASPKKSVPDAAKQKKVVNKIVEKKQAP